MFDRLSRPFRRIPIRIRLTLWYLLLAGLVMLAAGMYQYSRFSSSLLASVDSSLEISLSQALSSIDLENGRPAFQDTENQQLASRILLQSDFAVRLLGPDGAVLQSLGSVETDGPGSLSPGFETVAGKEPWRVYTQPVHTPDGAVLGWVQAVQSLDVVQETLGAMRLQLLLALPVFLLLIGVGGVFLANRALSPIGRITSTAGEIGAGELSRRISYQGPKDEVGRLADTFDSMLARLETAFRRERRFTGDAAHELRTPLTALKGQIEVALSRQRSRQDYVQVLQGLQLQVERLIRLSSALLFLSRSDQEQLAWEPAPLNLADLLTAVIEQLDPLAQDRALHIRQSLPAELPVVGDTDLLIRLFLNVLDNALKYTPPGGEVSISAAVDSDAVSVQVFNSGSGIPSEHLPHLFERFYRADYDRSSRTGGAGLGLAIAREIALKHGGRIEADSRAGSGNRFTVMLPAAGRPAARS